MSKAERVAKALLNAVFDPEEGDPNLKEEYEMTIGSILLDEEDPAKRFVNHLWYTIIDQRRDVKDFVIPMMASLMLSGIDPNAIVNNKEETREIITAVLSSYGHELKYSKADMKRLVEDGYYSRKLGSRSDAILDTVEKIKERYDSWKGFKNKILENRSRYMKDGKLRRKEVSEYPYVSEKSFSFFLRDIEPILLDPELIPIPIDSNVAQSIQLTGMLFDEWPPSEDEIVNKKKRDQQEAVEKITGRVRGLARTFDESPRKTVQLAQSLFLYGAEYCQKCPKKEGEKYRPISCPIKNQCMVGNHLNQRQIQELVEGVKGSA